MYKSYNFMCQQCGIFTKAFNLKTETVPKTTRCNCGKRAKQTFMQKAKARPNSPFYSKALGIHPCQINQMKKRFPHHEFNADGDMLIKNYREQKKITTELGMALH